MRKNIEENMRKSFVERFSTLIEGQKKSTRDVALGVQVSCATVHAWRRGKRVPNLKQIVAVTKFFSCTCDYLLGRTDLNMEKPSKLTP